MSSGPAMSSGSAFCRCPLGLSDPRPAMQSARENPGCNFLERQGSWRISNPCDPRAAGRIGETNLSISMWSEGTMTYPFTPVIFQTGRGYRLAITCLRDVAKAMSMSWPDKEHPSFRRAASLVEHAQAGWCTPHAAFEAFVQAVTGEGPIAVTGQDGREALAVALTIVSNIERSLPALAGRPVATSRA